MRQLQLLEDEQRRLRPRMTFAEHVKKWKDCKRCRLHEGRAKPWPRYGHAALRTWVERLASAYDDGAPTYAYFNNDPGGAAIIDAVAMAAAARRSGHPVSRAVP